MRNKLTTTVNAFFGKIMKNEYGMIKSRSFTLPLLLFGLSSKTRSIIIGILAVVVFILAIYLTIIFLRDKENKNKNNFQPIPEYQYDIKNDLLSHDGVKYNDATKISKIVNRRKNNLNK